MSSGKDLIDAVGPVIVAFDQLGIRYCVSGSVANSFHGAVRSTMDVDILGEIAEEQVTSLLVLLGDEYYANEPAIREAIRRIASFNLIDLAYLERAAASVGVDDLATRLIQGQ